MESMAAQDHLLRYYTGLGDGRGVQRVSNSGKRQIKRAEALPRIYPQVTDQVT
jgi:4-oxalomesaconate hydratase